MQFVLAREQYRWVQQTVVGLRGHGFNHPTAKLWHQNDVILLRKVAIIKGLDQFGAAVGQLYLLLICFIDLVFHFFAPFEISQLEVFVFVTIVY